MKGFFHQIYDAINGFALSSTDPYRQAHDDYSLVYGEIELTSFSELLKNVNPQPHECFYDLGAGTGKAVIASALFYPLNAYYGIEKLNSLHQASLQALQRLRSLAQHASDAPLLASLDKVQMIHDDFFHFDISQADIVFINASGFFGELKTQLITQLETLKAGSRVIISAKQLPESSFRLLNSQLCLMSWGESLVHTYTKIDCSHVNHTADTVA